MGHAQPPTAVASVYCACQPGRTDVRKPRDLHREPTRIKRENTILGDVEDTEQLYDKPTGTYIHTHTHTHTHARYPAVVIRLVRY